MLSRAKLRNHLEHVMKAGYGEIIVNHIGDITGKHTRTVRYKWSIEELLKYYNPAQEAMFTIEVHRHGLMPTCMTTIINE